jgi:hypothetical protein
MFQLTSANLALHNCYYTFEDHTEGEKLAWASATSDWYIIVPSVRHRTAQWEERSRSGQLSCRTPTAGTGKLKATSVTDHDIMASGPKDTKKPVVTDVLLGRFQDITESVPNATGRWSKAMLSFIVDGETEPYETLVIHNVVIPSCLNRHVIENNKDYLAMLIKCADIDAIIGKLECKDKFNIRRVTPLAKSNSKEYYVINASKYQRTASMCKADDGGLIEVTLANAIAKAMESSCDLVSQMELTMSVNRNEMDSGDKYTLGVRIATNRIMNLVGLVELPAGASKQQRRMPMGSKPTTNATLDHLKDLAI